MASEITAKNLLKTKGILTGKDEDTLTSALSKLTSSHDAVFVFDNKRQFLGVINPYYVIFKHKFPAETKLKHCLFSPPRLSLSMPFWKIAKLMVESKVYFLPVFDQDKNFAGIVSVGRLFKAISNNQKILKKIKIGIKKEIISVSYKATLGQTFSLMRQKGVSRLPVVNEYNHLMGIVTRFDLREAFASPQAKQPFLSRVGDKHKYLNKPLSSYYQKAVATSYFDISPLQLIKTMLDRKIGSVVIINKKREPIGIVSKRDILEAISGLKHEEEANIEIQLDDKFTNKTQAKKIFTRFIGKTDKKSKISKASFNLSIIKNQAGKPSRYAINTRLLLKNGQSAVAKVVDHDWRKALRSTLNKLERQL